MPLRRRHLIYLALLLVSLLPIRALAVAEYGVDGWYSFVPLPDQQSAADKEYTSAFLANSPDEQRFEKLFEYFAAGAIQHSDGPAIHYRGYPTIRGYSISGLEGFARVAPLLGAWVHSGRSHWVYVGAGNKNADLVTFIRLAILAGTDPRNPGYWGDMGENDQRIVEAADIARVLWLTRDQIWVKLPRSQQEQVVQWLLQTRGAVISARNNWLLFPAVVEAFLKSVGVEKRGEYGSYWEFKKSSYRTNGWFSDGPGGPVDFYNAWGISYDLYWIHIMDPELDRSFLDSALRESGKLTAYLIAPTGIPIMGRSICYRTAIPSPLIAASFLFPNQVDSGLARRALDLTWRYFLAHHGLRSGGLTMGYYDNDVRLVDLYTGPGSCHWGLRSLTLALMVPAQHPFWTSPQRPLPIERADYRIALPGLGWTVLGTRKDQLIRIVRPEGRAVARLDSQSFGQRLLEALLERPVRPRNNKTKYELKVYSNDPPLGGGLSATPPAETRLQSE